MVEKISLKEKQRAYRLGLRAESLAAFYLRLKGFSILERRYKTIHGEIDLIARRFNLVLIVEVKARSSVQQAVEAVSHEAQRRIERTARFWWAQQKNNHLLSLRFDLIAICPYRFPKQIKNFFS